MHSPYPDSYDPKQIAATGTRWLGAAAERRGLEARKRQEDFEAREAARAARASALTSLDLRTHTDSAPDAFIPEWQIGIRQLDGYRESVAIFRDEMPRSRKGRQSSPSEGLSDAVMDAAVSPAVACDTSSDEEKQANWDRTVRRSKGQLRWKVLGLRADRMCTLTTRGGITSLDEVWELWAAFSRLVNWRFHRGNPNGFAYVVVPELHKSGTYHIHFVTNQFYDVNVLRLLWHRVLTGKPITSILHGIESPGNIDIQKSRSRPLALSRYLAKYLGKTFESISNRARKRFASSKHIRPPERLRKTMPYASGSDIYFLHRMHAADGYKVIGCFEFEVAGQKVVWMACRQVGSRRTKSHGK